MSVAQFVRESGDPVADFEMLDAAANSDYIASRVASRHETRPTPVSKSVLSQLDKYIPFEK